ncbi:ClpP/crotonase-like domain-containing protein [Leucosporidium creatinivorum]|uniref:ClpP/crotonase-like domain-containing protein n=1 Tax=Leucosporidium creatinivorum TaxID=106004 RepID=A0A1Y2FA58_9BASI|nr:ClpP/crotonase-like domain-containing protein [Leucosporidium creatinivorum]
MTDELEEDICKVMDWFEEEPSLWVVVVTGTGRAFCAGQDLKAWNKTAGSSNSPTTKIATNPHGFGSFARRRSKKTLIAAVNGMSFGGGTELLLNCDIVVGCEGAPVGLPEVKRGVVASVGAHPTHLLAQHVFTSVVSTSQVLSTAIEWASRIVSCSPDAVWVTKEQINLWKDGKGIQEIVQESAKTEQALALYDGENLKEALFFRFEQKRQPEWRDPPALKKAKL